MTLLFDTHAHLCDDQFSQDRENVIERASGSGVKRIMEIADSPQGWDCARDLSLRYSNREDSAVRIDWTCGFHPHYAGDQEGFNFDIMKEAASSENCRAIGEIGLDYVKSKASKNQQISLFRKTLELSAEIGKPVVIHCREAQADTLRILKSFYGGLSGSHLCPGVVHCFSGDRGFAEGCLDLGFYLGVDGPITYPNGGPLREVISNVPLDRIVLETDSPYLPPQNFRGKRNESSYLVYIAGKMAEIFMKSAEELSKMTYLNSLRLYRLKEGHPR